MTDPTPLIRLEAVTKIFYTDEVETHALSGIHLDIQDGEYVAIATASVDEGDLGRPDRLRELQAKGVPFRLASDGAQADVKLQVIFR